MHQAVLSSFVKFPSISFNEVHIEYGTKKKLVGGSIDAIVGTERNGNKPHVHVDSKDFSKDFSIYLGSILLYKGGY